MKIQGKRMMFWNNNYGLFFILSGMIVYFLFEIGRTKFYSQSMRSLKDHHNVDSEGFQDEYFAPILSLFLKKARGELVPKLKSFRNGSVPRVLVWSQPFNSALWKHSALNHIKNGFCPLPCEVIFDIKKKETVDAVVIYVRGAKDNTTVTESLSPRDPRQPWIMFSSEAPPRSNNVHGTKFTNYDGLFNRTMYYRRDADIRVSNGFVVRRGEEAKSLPSSWVIPPIYKPLSDKPKKLAVAFISNCHAQTNRLQYIKRVQKYAPVDIYGACGSLKCGGSMYTEHRYNVTTHECLKMAGENYLFYMAFENSFCVDYVTEKVYNLMHHSMVPVVLGSADYAKLLPPNSYIDASKYSPKELAEKLLYLQRNPKEYQKYHEWRHHYISSTNGGEMVLCHLCARLYDPDFYEHKVIEDFYDWFVEKSRCLSSMNL